MPHFGFTSPWSWLSYRVGRLFGASVTRSHGGPLPYRQNEDRIRPRTIGMAVSLYDFVRYGWG